MQTGKPVFDASKLTAAAWAHATAAAEKWNQPGVFTTLHGFEWTSAPGGNNLHRTVIFRDGADRVNQVVPFSTFDSQDPADLWKYMDAYAKKTGGQVLAIPHNGNLSNGMMYSAETFDGKPMDRAYAEARASHEPLLEATQIKGDSETHPYLSPNDEFANFERWDINFSKMEQAQNSVLHGNYVRSALKLGLELDAKLGANPYQAGLIGGSDAHVGVVTTREDNFFGEFANGLPSPDRWKTPLAMVNNDPKKGPLVSVWNEQAAGLGGVWARENTREGIWDALKRKEVYATTGDRPIVRVFAGWDFVPADRDRPDFAANGYAHGVPMGGDLSKAPAGKRPVFMVHALRDPDGPNLDRIQIIKGWLGKDGKTQERIFDVAVSGGRKIGPDGRCKTPVGSTVDVANATYTNTIGAADAVGVLEGPDVRRYAARVLLRARDPDPVAALDGLRPEALRHQDGRLRSDDGHRPRLHFADLVYAVSRAQSLIGVTITAAGLAAGSSNALSCGFDDPNSISSARGMLNWMYPHALYVGTAVWNAEQQGTIARDERPAAAEKLFGYYYAVQRLGTFRDRLSAALDGGTAPAFTMVLFGSMLWTHFETTGDTLNMTPHVDGPSKGDVVVVTDEPVIAALINGRITPQAAHERGLMRFYGSPGAVSDLTHWLDRSLQGAAANAIAAGD